MNTDAEITGILVKRISDANTRITTFVPTIKLANGIEASDGDPLEVTGSYFDLEVSLPSGVSSEFSLTLPVDGSGNNIGTMSNIFDSFTVGLTLLSSEHNVYTIRVDITSVTEAGKYILEFVADLTIITRILLENSTNSTIVTEQNILQVTQTFQRNIDLTVQEESSSVNYKQIVTILIIVGIVIIVLGLVWYILLKRKYRRYLKNEEKQNSNEDSQSQSIQTLQNGHSQLMSYNDINNNTFEKENNKVNSNSNNKSKIKNSIFRNDEPSLKNLEDRRQDQKENNLDGDQEQENGPQQLVQFNLDED